MSKESYLTYYLQYLNYNYHTSVVSCEQRRIPLNEHYYYYVIATEIEGKDIYSVHPELYNSFIKIKQKDSIQETLEVFQLKHPSLTLRCFYRMSLGRYAKKLNNEAKVFTKDDLENGIQSLTEEEKKFHRIRQLRYIKQKNKFIVKKDNQIAAIARITDIDHGGGNIAVYSNPDFRCKGYGKMVVSKCIDWCADHDIIPIYLVDVDNTASVNLAKSLGFTCYSKEYALSIEI
ncbi:MAG: GNAT family N-acetyltransferase [Clostridiales bacterium]|nr:GNAT family N-acetyltransferase [Clostridiales bacterium]